jgi:HEAT repeat protein
MTAYQDDHPGFRVSAIYAMGRNCSSSWLPILIRELSSTEAEMRYEAAKACGELGEEEAVPRLAELIDDPDIDVRLVVIKALGEIGGSTAKKRLGGCLNDPSELISEAAEQALIMLEAGEDSLCFHLHD